MHLDKHNGTNLWRLAWEKDMENIQVDFDVKDEGKVAPVGYQEIGCYPIFDIKATTLTHKGRFVVGGHTMDKPAAMTYASVVYRERILGCIVC